MNIYLIQTLRMTHRGMKHIQLHTRQNPKTGQESKVLRFVADEMHLGKVVAKTGHVYGSPNSDLNIQGSRVSFPIFLLTLDFTKFWETLFHFNLNP